MRKIPLEKLNDLKSITSLLESEATSKLAFHKERVRALESEMAQLQSKKHKVQTIEELRQAEAWSVWRQQEIHALTLQLAVMKVELAQAAARAGKAIAENSVVDDLAKTTRKLLERSRAKATEERATPLKSHLLANDVGDQDI